ncbi:hypothetical protein AAG906_027140 [Vitis piasezkii]
MVLLDMSKEIKQLAFSRYSKLTFLLVVASHHHPIDGCQRSWEVTCHHSCPFALQAAKRGLAFSSAFCVPSSVSEVLGFLLAILGFFGGFCCVLGALGFLLWATDSSFGVESRIGMGMLVMLGSVSAPLSKMSANKDAASSSAGQSGKDASGEVPAEKSVDKLNVREFCERFYIPNGVSVQLVDGEAVSTEKSADNAIFFTKEQFNRARFLLPFFVQRISPLHPDRPPTSIPTWSGTNGCRF